MKRTILILLLTLLLLLCACVPVQREQPVQNTAFVPDYQILPEDEPEDPQARLQWRRDVVEQQMRHMLTVLWTPEQDITYSAVPQSAGVEADRQAAPDQVITLQAGRIYQGIPYTHGCSGSFSFLSYATSRDEKGVYTISDLGTDSLTGIGRSAPNQSARIGNDCADAVAMAWSMVSSSIYSNETIHMTEYNGLVKVGDYACDMPVYSSDTTNVAVQNGRQKMYQSYAQLQKGDALVHVNANGSGHAVMAVDVHVTYDGNEIDGAKSYVTILQQDIAAEKNELSYYDQELNSTVYMLEELDVRLPFMGLYSIGYLPVTCKELVDPSDLPKPTVEDFVSDPNRGNMFSNVIHASYRIASVTISIMNPSGEELQKSTCFAVEQTDKYSFDLSRFLLPTEQSVLQGKLDLDALPAGEYRCTYTCRLATGREIVFRDFTLKI